jgi:hypothetical protein
MILFKTTTRYSEGSWGGIAEAATPPRSRRSRCSRQARRRVDDVDKSRPNYGAIVDGALALHGAVLVVADVVGLLVVCSGYGCGLALDLPLQPASEELLGVQAHDARVGGDLGSVLVVERAKRARCYVCCCGDAAKGRRRSS